MNPGGDYGKKELSPALRNRFTEIWVSSVSDVDELRHIARERYVSPSGRFYAVSGTSDGLLLVLFYFGLFFLICNFPYILCLVRTNFFLVNLLTQIHKIRASAICRLHYKLLAGMYRHFRFKHKSLQLLLGLSARLLSMILRLFFDVFVIEFVMK